MRKPTTRPKPSQRIVLRVLCLNGDLQKTALCVCVCVFAIQGIAEMEWQKAGAAMTSREQQWNGEGWEGCLSVRSEKLCSETPWKRWKQQKKNTVAKEQEPKGKEIHRKESHACGFISFKLSAVKNKTEASTGKGRRAFKTATGWR